MPPFPVFRLLILAVMVAGLFALAFYLLTMDGRPHREDRPCPPERPVRIQDGPCAPENYQEPPYADAVRAK